MKHNQKTIELELRAEIPIKEIRAIRSRLKENGKMISCTQRLSVMFFGTINDRQIDIRVRITNGQCEVVAKLGSFGAHDRIEVAQPISKRHFLGFVKIFSKFGFTAKVGERVTYNYNLPGGITVSVVIAKSIAYIEIEKLSLPEQVERNTKKLYEIAHQLQLKLLNDNVEFDRLCKQLDKKADWPFFASANDYRRLNKSLKKY